MDHIDLEKVWEILDYDQVQPLLEDICKKCQQDRGACEDCDWYVDNKRNVVFRTAYFHEEDLL